MSRSVRFTTNGDQAWGSTLVDANTGAALKCVRRVTADVTVGEPITVEAEFSHAEIAIEGRLVAYFADPASGELKAVAKVIFADGSEWEA
jgi:hypothetical protein